MIIKNWNLGVIFCCLLTTALVTSNFVQLNDKLLEQIYTQCISLLIQLPTTSSMCTISRHSRLSPFLCSFATTVIECAQSLTYPPFNSGKPQRLWQADLIYRIQIQRIFSCHRWTQQSKVHSLGYKSRLK